MSKLKTALWFIKNPTYMAQIFQVLKRKRNKSLENSGVASLAWCRAHCTGQREALRHLTGQEDLPELGDLFPVEIRTAHAKEVTSPVKMGGGGASSFIYHLASQSGAQDIIETGVAYGWSSLAILLAVKNRPDARLISNDMPYINMGNDDYVGCIVPENLRDKWELQRLPDIKGIPLALSKFKGEIDFCHYDSDKSYTGRMWASPLLWNALKKNGLFVADDINDNIAFKHFCEAVHRTPVIIEHSGKYVGVIVK